MSADLWQRGCERLAAELPELQFNTWIRPLPPAEIVDSGDGAADSHATAVATLRVPNRFKLDWIRSQYAPRIESVLTELAGKPVRLEIMLSVGDAAGAARAPTIIVRNNEAANQRPDLSAPAEPAQRNGISSSAPPGSTAFDSQQNRYRLNTALTFDTLVPGRANQMARTAALHVAGAPGHMYNPLFIYGGVGLG
ncbi:MAG: DnaA N-terminal domain-containing protein, partial [Ideonella sp.]